MTLSLATNTNVNMTISSSPNALNANLVVALNVVSLDDYVTREELDSMNVMTWGSESEEN